MNSNEAATAKTAAVGHQVLPFLRIQKIGQRANPVVATADWKNYQPGSAQNTESPPEGYTLFGWLLESIKLGRPVRLLRMERNGVAALGYFETTPVAGLTSGGVETENSIYQVDWVAIHEQ